MKIDVEKGMDKAFLADGRHVVEITHIDEGSSESKDVPFFACRFENEDGFVNQRFYLSDPGMSIIMELCQAAGVDVQGGKQLDTNQLLHKKLSIEVAERSYQAPDSGNERTLKQASGFEAV